MNFQSSISSLGCRFVHVMSLLILGYTIAGNTVASDGYGRNETSTDWKFKVVSHADSSGAGFGENINLYDRSVAFSNTDIDLPGLGPSVKLMRTMPVVDLRGNANPGLLLGFGEWSIEIPNISGVFQSTLGWKLDGPAPYNRCSDNVSRPVPTSGFSGDEYWSGSYLDIPGALNEMLLSTNGSTRVTPADGRVYPWATKGGWAISCLAATKNGYPGQAFLAISPEGTKYYFDWVVSRSTTDLVGYLIQMPLSGDWVNTRIARSKFYFLASRVEDRHGNWVNYNYSADNLVSITASDGRSISIAYANNKIASATAAGRTFTYSYYPSGALKQAIRPDGSAWSYAATGQLEIEHDQDMLLNMPKCRMEAFGGENYAYEVTSPSGLKGTFNFSVSRQMRQNAPRLCVGWQEGRGAYAYWVTYWQIPLYFDLYALDSKTISGPGVTTTTWQYFTSGMGHPGGFSDTCSANPSSCPLSKQTIVISPTQYQRYTYGIWWDVNDRQLLTEETGASASAIQARTDYVYASEAEANLLPFGVAAGKVLHQFSSPLAGAFRPLKKRVTHLDGRSYTWEVSATCGSAGTSLCFDAYARPTKVIKSSTP